MTEATVRHRTEATVRHQDLQQMLQRRVQPKTAAQLAILPLGVTAIDRHLPEGGLRRAALHEVQPAGGMASAGAVAGFAAALTLRAAASLPDRPVLWIAPGQGLYAPGLAGFGLEPQRLLLLHGIRRAEDRLWAAEQAARSGAFAAVVAEAAIPDLTVARRLHLAAETGGMPLLILPGRAEAGTTAAMTRWRIRSHPSTAARDLTGASLPGVGAAAWDLDLIRCRGGQPGRWLVHHHGLGRLSDRPALPELLPLLPARPGAVAAVTATAGSSRSLGPGRERAA